MRKLLKTILVLLLSFNICISVVYADDTKLYVAGEEVSANAGETVQVKFRFENNPGVAMVAFDISYDETALTLTNLNGNSLVGGMFTEAADQNYISWMSLGGNSTYTGVFFTATFKVSETAVAGEYEVSLTESYDDSILNSNYETITATYTFGSIVVGNSLTEDITGDGVWDASDFVVLKKVVLGVDTVTDKAYCDLNGDGNVGAADLVYLKKMLGSEFYESDKVPTVALSSNASSPAKIAENTANITTVLSISDFSAVAAADITIELDNNLTLTNATLINSETDSEVLLIKGKNYIVTDNCIKFVDVFNIAENSPVDSLEIELNLTVSGEIGRYPITVSGDMVNGNAETIAAQYTSGVVVIGRKEFTVTNVDDIAIKDGENCFIPYGATYYVDSDNQIVYLEKGSDGTFTVPDEKEIEGDITVLKCALPTDDKEVTTFASSNADSDQAAIQFGTYVPQMLSEAKYGTFLVIGDISAFKAEKNLEDEQLYAKIAAVYDKANSATGKEFISFSYNNGNDKIYVVKKQQSKYMWKNETSLQYALRVYNIDVDETYTAVGYSFINGTYNFSTEVVSTVYSESN